MSRPAARTRKQLGLLTRAGVILLMLGAPVLAVPGLRAADGPTIEAPALKKTGMGLVLLVSLRRG